MTLGQLLLEIQDELTEAVAFLHDLPGGVDEHADPYDKSPRDAVAWTGGVVVAKLEKLIAKIEHWRMA